MRFIDIRVYEHPSVPSGEALLIRRPDSGEVPTELRRRVKFPCILTGDASRLGRDLTLRQIAEAYEASGRGPMPSAAGGVGVENHA